MRPGDDFFLFANGAWVKRTEIPPDRAGVGVFNALADIASKRTASLIEGLGTHYDSHFNALAFATPIALSLRGPILESLYPDGPKPTMDTARVVGAAIGAVARIVRQASRDVYDAVRDAIAEAALPSSDELRGEPLLPSTNGSAVQKRTTVD